MNQRDFHRADQTAPAAESAEARGLLQRIAQVAYVLGCHREAIAKHSRHLAELQAELDRMEGQP